MKKLIALLLAATMVIGVTSAVFADDVKITAPMVGYNEDQIADAEAKDDGPDYTDNYRMAVTNSVAEKYPDYEMEYVDWGWAESLDQKQRSLFSAGTPSNIVAGETFMPTYAAEGLLEPLPDDIVESVNPTFLLSDPDGVPVAVAYKTSIFMLFFNKDLMEKAGLDPETPPTTWSEWKEMSDKITEAGDGEFYGGGIPTFPHAGGAFRATPFFRQMGTDFALDGVQNLDDPALQETLEFIREMNHNFPEGLGNGTDEDPLWSAFHDNQLGFVINGSWEAAESTTNEINWGVAPLPLPDDGGEVGNCTVGSVFLAVPKNADFKEEAFNVIREAISADNEAIWLTGSYCPATKEIIEDEELYKDDICLVAEMEEIRNGVYSGLALFEKNDAAIWEIIDQQVLQRVTMTEDPIDEICQDAIYQIEPLQK